jgi:hypothetical protein
MLLLLFYLSDSLSLCILERSIIAKQLLSLSQKKEQRKERKASWR